MIRNAGSISTGLGYHHIRFSTVPCDGLAHMQHCLYKLLAVLPRNWELVYGGEDLRLAGIREPEFARSQ